jgi:hypothetical protein
MNYAWGCSHAAAPQLVDADIYVDVMLIWRYLSSATQQFGSPRREPIIYDCRFDFAARSALTLGVTHEFRFYGSIQGVSHMKSKLYSMLLVAVLAAGSIFSWNVYADKKQSPKVSWEYNLVTSTHGDNGTRLTELGNDGWELVSVRTEDRMIENFRQTKVFYYLKRQKQIAK